MGFAYALVHLKFTIPVAAALFLVSRPFLTRLDAARVLFLTAVAVAATIPWDAHLISAGVWTYPAGGVLGPVAWRIPVEELFFFVAQTFITSLVYVLCNKPVLLAQYLCAPAARPPWIRNGKIAGQACLAALTAVGWRLAWQGGRGTYMGLILGWACPFALVSWSFAGEMILAMPWTSTVLPILAPTLYLWFVDERSLRSGVWTIEPGTKLGRQLFGSLEVEEAVFFLATNALIVFGLAAVDQAIAVCDAFANKFPVELDSLNLASLLRARAMPASEYDMDRITGIKEAVSRLRRKSRSFYLASSVFPGRLRIDLTLLYSYCRLADDLVDNASSPQEALTWISKLRKHLELRYGNAKDDEIQGYINSNFPASAASALELLPSHILSAESLYALLEGFNTDVEFETEKEPPIHDEPELELYAARVAGTIGELCLDLVFHHVAHTANTGLLHSAAMQMGIALQYVNIARDVAVDAAMGRVYLPTAWLTEEGLTTASVLAKPSGPAVERLRNRLLGKAFASYRESRPAMDLLPAEARKPMVVAVESYMEIGRVLAQGKFRAEGKATVPAWRRVKVVWKTLRGR